MIFAQILNGIIMNTIILNDLSLIPLFTEGFDSCIRIDQLSIQPSIGWTYDGTNFSPPVGS
jgi:hypothetical protein